MTREEKHQLQKDKGRLRVQFSKFEKLILDFQLKTHEKFLDSFNRIFKRSDKDRNGIINENEFVGLVEEIDHNGAFGLEIDDMLDLLDPF